MRFFNVLMPIIGLATMLGEAGVTYAGMFHPHVDSFYRDFYVKGYRSCWLTPSRAASAQTALNTDDINIGKLDAPIACFLLARGWSHVEAWGVWSDGGKAAIELPVEPGKSRLDVKLLAFSPRNRQVVKVYLNNAPVGSYFVPSPGPSELTLTIPPSVTGDLTLLFQIKHPRVPPAINGRQDRRRLGIGLISIKWG